MIRKGELKEGKAQKWRGSVPAMTKQAGAVWCGEEGRGAVVLTMLWSCLLVVHRQHLPPSPPPPPGREEGQRPAVG